MVERAKGAFTRKEYARRVKLTKEAMANEDIDTLFIVEHGNLVWLTGFTAESAYVEQSLVIDAFSEEPMLCVRQQDFAAAVHLSFMDRARIHGFAESLIANPDANGYDRMAELMRDAGLLRGRIGVEMGILSHNTVAQLKKSLSGADLVDATGLVTWLRLPKSDEEITVMQQASDISDAAMQAAIDRIEAGARESSAVKAALGELCIGIDGAPATQLEGINFCSTPLTGTSHIQWRDTTYQDGSQINIELGGVRHRYASGLMRTVHVGTPPDQLVKLHAAEVEGLAAALAAAKVGNTCADVANAFQDTIRRYGFEKLSRCGYAMGINWTEESASLKSDDHTVLEPGMTFHLMLGNWIDEDFGMVLSETFVVRETGGEALGKLPRELFVK